MRAGHDGRLTDLDSPDSPALTPWISDNWRSHFKWNGLDPISPEERARLRALVERIHRAGRKVRFWGGSMTGSARTSGNWVRSVATVERTRGSSQPTDSMLSATIPSGVSRAAIWAKHSFVSRWKGMALDP